MKTYTLDVYSWAGLSLGAIHFYGEIHDPEGRMVSEGRLKRPLSEDDAKLINLRLHLTYREDYYEMYKVRPGEIDHRFNREKDVIDEAIKQFLSMEVINCILILKSDGRELARK